MSSERKNYCILRTAHEGFVGSFLVGPTARDTIFGKMTACRVVNCRKNYEESEKDCDLLMQNIVCIKKKVNPIDQKCLRDNASISIL